MGTRAAYGFIVDGEQKSTYCHSDGYVDGLGFDLLTQFCDLEEAELKEAVRNIILVNNDTSREIVSVRDLEALKPFFNGEVASDNDFWYRALRGVQGDIRPYVSENPVRFMINGNDFFENKLFCEYGYLINFDTRMFEFYYSGKELAVEVPFDTIKKAKQENLISEFCSKLESYISFLKYGEYGDEEEIEQIKSKESLFLNMSLLLTMR